MKGEAALAPNFPPAGNLDEPIIRYIARHHRLHPLLLPHQPLHFVIVLSEHVCAVSVVFANMTVNHKNTRFAVK